jgi:hypothetical protein
MKLLTFFSAALALAASASALPPGAHRLVRLGQTARIGPLAVTPLEVVEDSRCPVTVRCVWAGRLIIRARVAGGGRSETRKLALGEAVAVHGIRLVLSSAEPDKLFAERVPRSRYRFAFERR